MISAAGSQQPWDLLLSLPNECDRQWAKAACVNRCFMHLQDRRKEMGKLASKYGEDGKVALR